MNAKCGANPAHECNKRFKVSDDMAGIAFDVLMETGALASVISLWEQEFRQLELSSNPTLIAIFKREALRQ